MPADRPNVLLICSDHHRYDYVGCVGNRFVHTPNMDRLAARGTVFTHCVTNCPACLPARCSLASGLQPNRFGALTNNLTCLPWPTPTFYQQLRDAGYWTGFTGKLHVRTPLQNGQRSESGRLPAHAALGFCEPFQASMQMAAVDRPSNPYTLYLQEQGLWEQYNEDRRRRPGGPSMKPMAYNADFPFAFEHRTDSFVTRRALRWIDDRPSEHPWFLQVNLINPHPPFDPCPEYASKYRDAPLPQRVLELEGKPQYIQRSVRNFSEEEVTHARRQFLAMVEETDVYVGMLLDKLEQRGELESTLVIYTSDHGEMLGDFNRWSKHVAYEPSIRVPLIVAGPGVPAGRHSEALIEWSDLGPTICEVAGTAIQQPIDARSFAPLLRGEAQAHRPDVLSVHEPFSLLRTSTHKYVQNVNDHDELYDLEADPRETRNLLAESPSDGSRKLAAELRSRLHRRLVEG